MSGSRRRQIDPGSSAAVRREAAAWIARLHDNRSGSNLEASLQEWLRASDEHRRAFNRMTRAWEEAGKIRMRARDEILPIREVRPRLFLPWAAVAATLVLAVGIAVYFSHYTAFVTGVGQQRVQVLQDGTRIALNTDTRIEVKYDKSSRRVRLVRGEARFDVSKRPTWPFVVDVGGQEVRALGTSFIVRHDAVQEFSVTLVEGRISVMPTLKGEGTASQTPRILDPGERLTAAPHKEPAVDRPDLDRVTAWQRGRVEFDGTPLVDAANEMNRYNIRHLKVVDPQVARLRIGGVFRAGDSDEFLKVVTAVFALRTDTTGADIVLSRPGSDALPTVHRLEDAMPPP
jgi:transmembrane sensor